ncbi:hypothetical protein P691DRAFT_662637 [Macrolepiota fuliginosa MF-IS2]|uniref:BHLH domain-containing protein n=1 Tax=Macrolepiota fuliginosa MF-IS2 TaxID=1400762 RepID=A0A9P5XHY8_9AGAR|nr:hypothetical protein P691DRAFT_662637 [Macrolepiota fuliginosa MF-IS2]
MPPRQLLSSYAPHKDLHPARLSPIAPLAPLEYLQNQRRGSITDPSLHAASTSSGLKLPSSLRPDHSVSPSSSIHNGSNPKSNLPDPRPNSPYVFGDANSHPSENTSPHLRNLLRSPSLEPQTLRSSSHESHDHSRPKQGTQGLSSKDSIQKLSIDTDRNGHSRSSIRDPLPFDYNMRRHSIATGQHPHPHPILPPVHGIKRKMSVDRAIFAPVGEEPDSQLVGPGVPSVMEVDSEGPAPKRRGSAIDTQRIAQLSLNDRRGSTDSRGPVPWWNSERRDSASSMLSNPSSTGGYSSGFTGGDSPHARLPASIAAFSWPNSQPNDPSTPGQSGTDPSMPSNLPRPFDTNPPANSIPPLNYPPDRRMSVPDTLISPGGPPKALRPRSRPPSRQGQVAEPITRTNSGQDNLNVAGSSAAGGKKDAGPTPYSRSPELRVSHKLAERKRRKEMKDLFDELRDQLPADRGMKASKWEILTKAIDFVVQLKQSNQDMIREIERLRQEVDIARGGPGSLPSFQPGPPPPSHIVYGQVPQVPIIPSQGPPPPLLQPPLPGPGQLPLPRTTTQNTYPSITSNSASLNTPNGGLHRSDVAPP